MCVGISAIAVQRGSRRLYFKPGVNGHSEIRTACNISDKEVGEQVNLEAHLKGDFFNLKDWELVIDHEVGEIPQWFKDNQPEIEGLFWSFLEDEIKETLSTGCYCGNLKIDVKSAKNLILPKYIKGCLDLDNLEDPSGLVLPVEIGTYLSLNKLTSAKNLTLSKKVGSLFLNGLTSDEGLIFPDWVNGDIFLSKLKSIECSPPKMRGYIHFRGS